MQLSADKGLIVTLPDGVSSRQLQAWVASKQDWVLTNLARLAQIPPPPPPTGLPENIVLPAINRTLQLDYTHNPGHRIRAKLDPDTGRLRLSGAVSDHRLCCQALQQWTKAYAKQPLGELLQQASRETGLNYVSYRVKGQKTRWGSCSTRGNINLNYKLLLLPANWVRYTLIHELCHTLEMNHSKRFWHKVEQFVPDYQHIHAQMRGAMQRLPDWTQCC